MSLWPQMFSTKKKQNSIPYSIDALSTSTSNNTGPKLPFRIQRNMRTKCFRSNLCYLIDDITHIAVAIGWSTSFKLNTVSNETPISTRWDDGLSDRKFQIILFSSVDGFPLQQYRSLYYKWNRFLLLRGGVYRVHMAFQSCSWTHAFECGLHSYTGKLAVFSGSALGFVFFFFLNKFVFVRYSFTRQQNLQAIWN